MADIIQSFNWFMYAESLHGPEHIPLFSYPIGAVFGRVRMVVVFTTICAISAYRH
jgi:hypothetical protein